MPNKFSITLTTAFLSFALLSACTDDDTDSTTVKTEQSSPTKAVTKAAPKETIEKPKATAKPDYKASNVLKRAMDLSSQKAVKKSMNAVKTEAGGNVVSELMQAMQYLLKNDPSVHKNKKQLYKKLNGMTPNEIFEMAGR
jgi:hypothetical protein